MPSPSLSPIPDTLLNRIIFDSEDLDTISRLSYIEAARLHRLDSARQLQYGSCISSPVMERAWSSPHLRRSYTTASQSLNHDDKRRPEKPSKRKPSLRSSRSTSRRTTVISEGPHFNSFGSQEYYHAKQRHKQIAVAAAAEPQSKFRRRKTASTVFGREFNCGGWSICSGTKSVDTVNINSTSGQRFCKTCAAQRSRRHADQPGGYSEGKPRQRQLSRRHNASKFMDSPITISMSPSLPQERSYNTALRSVKWAESSAESIVFDKYGLPNYNCNHVRMGPRSSSSHRRTKRNRRRVERNSSPYSLKSDNANLEFANGSPLSDLLRRSSCDLDAEARQNHNQVSISPARPSWPSVTSNDELSNEHNGTTHPIAPSSTHLDSAPAIEKPTPTQAADLSFRFMDACTVSSTSPENQSPSTMINLSLADAHDKWVEVTSEDYQSTDYNISMLGKQSLSSFRFPNLSVNKGQNVNDPMQQSTRVLSPKLARHELDDLTSSEGLSVEVGHCKSSDVAEASSLSSSSVKVKVNGGQLLLNTSAGAYPANKPYSNATISNSFRRDISSSLRKPSMATFEVTPPYITAAATTSRRTSTSTSRKKGHMKGDSSSRRRSHYEHELNHQLHSPAKLEILTTERRTSRLTPSRRDSKFRRKTDR